MMIPCLLFASAALASAQAVESAWTRSASAFDGAAASAASVRPRSAAAPPTTQLTLSQLAEAIKNDPAALDELLDRLGQSAGQLGVIANTPGNRARIKDALNRANPSVLDRFPILTPSQAALAATIVARQHGVSKDPQFPAALDLALPHSPVDPPQDHAIVDLGRGFKRGDDSVSIPGAPWADTNAVAFALDMLSLNDPSAPGHILTDDGVRYAGILDWMNALLAQGHSIEVRDSRYYANFGHLRYESRGVRYDVTTPTRVDTGIVLPGGKPLIVPVSHSELDISIRGPRVNAEMSFYFGVNGAVGFHAFDTRDMAWVGGRTVKAWTGADAARLLDRAGWVRRELMAKAKAAGLPMGGYGPLGDCNDADAMVTGIAPYPMLRDKRRDGGASEFDRLSASLPYDLDGKPDPRRVWDSRPFENPDDIPFDDVRGAMKELKAFLGP